MEQILGFTTTHFHASLRCNGDRRFYLVRFRTCNPESEYLSLLIKEIERLIEVCANELNA